MSKKSGIVAIVEGKGDKQAVPCLIRRILQQRGRYDVAVTQAKEAKGKQKLLKEFERFLGYAIVDRCTAILVLLDADDECPREEVVHLSRKAAALQLKVPVAIVYAQCEYENWLIWSLSSERGTKIKQFLGLPEDVVAPDNTETIRDAKGWLTGLMPRYRSYEVRYQEPLTWHIDLDLVREKSRSFRRLCHAIEELVYAMDQGMTIVTPRPN